MPLARMPADVLNRLAADSNAECFTFVDGAAASAAFDLEKAAAIFEAEPQAAATLTPLTASSPLLDVWQRFPARMAALAHPPGRQTGLLIRRSAFNESGGFEAVADPLWDWLIRATRDRRTIFVADQRADAAEPEEAHIEDDDLPPLVPPAPGRERRWLQSHLQSVGLDELVPNTGTEADAVALKAGLFGRHDFLDASHELSQSVQGQGRHRAGDYWHAIMHRREPDFSNSKYWFGRVGDHPLFAELARRAAVVLERSLGAEAADWKSRLQAPHGWDPFAFVDLCEQCRRTGDAGLGTVARKIQFAEMSLLLEHTYRDAGG